MVREVNVELIEDPELGGFTARLPDLPVYGEGETEDEAIADLREAVQGYVETFGLEDTLNRIAESIRVRSVSWEFQLAHG